ncbi:Ig-like domain-containing protein [Solwaraspora sp. WMMD1047]|uniref:Ig-like domain-containing protein n=1 Tax=Solwaraspora sp. WMMD1047 TaxID=3016102 RepID=UPI002416F839|nr:Ig-like domain-containing protein [Solwaraspora sp. WMMD1047]MDG4831521.1 Ig-like domain-containing protein [Solwaraspora sp. WMMD1047]
MRHATHRTRRTRVAALTALAVVLILAPPATARAQAVTPIASINFQPATAAVPAGHTADTGAAYDAARGRGWIRQDSVGSTAVPLDLTANTRNRNRSGVDARLNTLIHLQYGDTGGGNGVASAGAWEYALPAGTYQVTVSAGDQSPYDSLHTIRVEGVAAVEGFRSTAGQEYRAATVTVPVADGRLTVDAIGGTNTKLTHLQIARVSDDTDPPPVPTGLTVTPGDSQVALAWTAGTAPDLAGYRVYRDGALISGTALLTTSGYADTTAVNGTGYGYAVSAVDADGNESARSATVTATPAAYALRVNFSDAATPPPAGYLRDSGEAFGTARGYGWLTLTGPTPLSLVGNGRNRGTAQPDVRLATLLHAQLPAGGNGVSTPGRWEAAVPAGSYTVTVSVGDAGTATDSAHWLSVEDQNAVAAFAPTAAVRHASATRVVTVTDGRLTLSPASGTNTKLNYVDIASVPAAAAIPSVRAATPANLATGVPQTTSVVLDLRLPGGGVDPATLTASTVTLARAADGAAVDANVITSGGGDVVNLSPTAPLQPATRYRLTLTAGVRDIAGRAFSPYTMVFSTGTVVGPGGPVAFDQTLGVATGAPFTTVVVGPDNRLYAGTLDGRIHRFPINADGTLGTGTVITTVRDHATAAGLAGAPNRTVIGMAFDPASTAAAPILWITDNYRYVGSLNVPDWSSRIARLTGPNLGTYTDAVINLPRSVKDHETNSLAFGPDGALYLTQGSNNAMGAPDATWGNRPERLLSAAVLRLDPDLLPTGGPLDAKTGEGGDYHPWAPGAALTIHASGVRNAYDLVWHRNGHLYVPTNGSAAGGNTPGTPDPLPAACDRRIDGDPYPGPAVPALTGVPTAETDYVFDVDPGRYYGHPNPARCEWVLAGGNPTAETDPFQVPAYPAGTAPDPNLDLAGMYDAGLHASANGVIEYRGGAFDGALAGRLLVVRYSAGQDIITFDVAAGGALANRTTGRTGFTGFNQPLDLVEHLPTGNLYVTELGASRISLLRPSPAGSLRNGR